MKKKAYKKNENYLDDYSPQRLPDSYKLQGKDSSLNIQINQQSSSSSKSIANEVISDLGSKVSRMQVVPSKESKLEIKMEAKRTKQEATALTQLSANILEILAGGEKSVSQD